MRFFNTLKIFLIAIILFTPILREKIFAQNSTTTLNEVTPLSIAIPSQGQVITTTSLTISGKAPAGVLITVTIQDEDYQKAFQVHEINLITNGTTTSDKNGDWVFIPATNLVPGRFSVSASYLNASNANVSVEKIFFTVADGNGSTSWFSIPGGTLIIIFVIIIIFLLFVIFRFVGVKKRRIFIHTSLGDIPAKEIIGDDNSIEVVPLSEPMINLGPPILPNAYAAQPNVYQQIQQPQILQSQPQFVQQPVALTMQPQTQPQFVQPNQQVVVNPQVIPAQPQVVQQVPVQPQAITVQTTPVNTQAQQPLASSIQPTNNQLPNSIATQNTGVQTKQ